MAQSAAKKVADYRQSGVPEATQRGCGVSARSPEYEGDEFVEAALADLAAELDELEGHKD